ncbi:hypothetical protein OS493_032693 [Desmophyllum pertusum]|uniref:Uncharacterized protein n=1 Tax=Desmophyllum pertusum TaxID=174260 RepID=A0A9W9ZXB2_9CNID|nr:hypothetical protein OS493_032693 [Desmophyllum pertusum]
MQLYPIRDPSSPLSVEKQIPFLVRSYFILQRWNTVFVLQKRELDALRGSKKTSSLSSNSTDSNRLQRRRSSQSKTTQVQPSLTDRSTSPILKEIRVKSSSNQACQTEAKDTTDKIPDNVTEANETWLTMQDNIQLKKELLNVKSELEALKKKQSLLPMISEGQTTSKAVIQPLDEQTKGKNILPVPPMQRHAGLPMNQETESLPHILQPKPPGQTQDSKTKTCVHLQRKKGFRPLSSPVRVSPLQNPCVQRQPIRPIEMYSQCKCPGCVRALAEESMTVLCDKKSPKQSEILPSIGDHVVVRSDLTGVVKYIGPVCGEKTVIRWPSLRFTSW